uniref:POU-specific atypical domain-containing protein n=1 Tax=Meloidogyne incognita TaxID=6306 RepID=A0A914NPS8_MELIC
MQILGTFFPSINTSSLPPQLQQQQQTIEDNSLNNSVGDCGTSRKDEEMDDFNNEEILPPPTTTTTNQQQRQHQQQTSSSSSSKSIRSQRAPIKEIISLDDPNELEKFMSKGEEQCIQDMRTFITQFSLRQTTVALMTGVSQPYISKLLNGNHRELSLRCRKVNT